jgi:hypothetical protein
MAGREHFQLQRNMSHETWWIESTIQQNTHTHEYRLTVKKDGTLHAYLSSNVELTTFCLPCLLEFYEQIMVDKIKRNQKGK